MVVNCECVVLKFIISLPQTYDIARITSPGICVVGSTSSNSFLKTNKNSLANKNKIPHDDLVPFCNRPANALRMRGRQLGQSARLRCDGWLPGLTEEEGPNTASEFDLELFVCDEDSRTKKCLSIQYTFGACRATYF